MSGSSRERKPLTGSRGREARVFVEVREDDGRRGEYGIHAACSEHDSRIGDAAAG
jgi:hypothetical protein